MKKDLHPSNYRLVVFKDMSNEYSFLTKSCINTNETVKWEDGNEYPLVKLEISHTSHPFYTGKMKLVDTAGRIDKFKTRPQTLPDPFDQEMCPENENPELKKIRTETEAAVRSLKTNLILVSLLLVFNVST